MLTTLILILLALLLILREVDVVNRRQAASAKVMNKSLDQMMGKLDSLHETIIRLWACPICSGFGTTTNLSGGVLTPKTCQACKGTGMKQANPGG